MRIYCNTCEATFDKTEDCKCPKPEPLPVRSESSGSVEPRIATRDALLNYIEHDVKMMPIKQLRKTYKHIRKIVAGLE